MADLPPLPPRRTDQPRPASAAATKEARPAKPDARPMRVVYGAGAVAVASVMAVGLVQPDFTATADQQASTDPNSADQGQRVGEANTAQGNNGQANADQGNSGQGKGNADQATPQVRHVTKYIHLKPGQTAPPGATVIQPGQPTPRIVVNNAGSPPTQPPNHNPKPPVTTPPPVHNPPPPTPKPTQKTHQSGHP